MKTERLEIGQSLALESNKWGGAVSDEVVFEFTGHIGGAYGSEQEMSVAIDAKTAQDIIKLLTKHFEF
jgi:hypothetical protein